MRGEGYTPLGANEAIHITLTPKIIDAADNVGILLGLNRTQVIRYGLSKVFLEVSEKIADALAEMEADKVG